MVQLSDEDIRARSWDYNVVTRFIPFVRPYKKDAFKGLFFVLSLTIASLFIPLVIKDMIDDAGCIISSSCQNPVDVQNALLYGLIKFLGLSAIIGFSIFMSESIIERMGEKILLDMRTSMFLHLQNVSISFMDKTDIGRLMSRLQGDVAAMQEALQMSVFAIGDFVLLIGIISVLLIMNVQLGILTILIIPILILIRLIWLPRAKKAFLDARIKSSLATSYLAENINGVRTVQSFNRQNYNGKIYEEKASDLFKAQVKATKLSALMMPTVETLTGLAFAIIIIMGANLVINDKIKFDNVSFAYVDDNYILRNFNLEIKNGERIGIVGPTGAGKSTISNLIHRFYDANKGKIILGGVDIKKMSQTHIGKNVGMVLQDPFLFSGSILDNVRYGEEKISLDLIKEESIKLGIDEFIQNLPNKYETVIVQRGSDLSMGQRQLLSILRALLADTKYLILDEATSSIDSYTEKKIQSALDVLLTNRTSITIAHRLATVRNCDRIIVLNQGEIIEVGNHEDLLNDKGMYSKLYSLNYSSFDD